MASRSLAFLTGALLTVCLGLAGSAWAKHVPEPARADKPARRLGPLARMKQTWRAFQAIQAKVDQADPELSTDMKTFRYFTTRGFGVARMSDGILGAAYMPSDPVHSVKVYPEVSRQALTALRSLHNVQADIDKALSSGGFFASYLINGWDIPERVEQLKDEIPKSMWKATEESWLGTFMNHVHWAKQRDAAVTDRQAVAYFLRHLMWLPDPDVAVVTERVIATNLMSLIQTWVSPSQVIPPTMNVSVDRGYLARLPPVTKPLEQHELTPHYAYWKAYFRGGRDWWASVNSAAQAQEGQDRQMIEGLARDRAAAPQ